MQPNENISHGSSPAWIHLGHDKASPSIPIIWDESCFERSIGWRFRLGSREQFQKSTAVRPNLPQTFASAATELFLYFFQTSGGKKTRLGRFDRLQETSQDCVYFCDHQPSAARPEDQHPVPATPSLDPSLKRGNDVEPKNNVFSRSEHTTPPFLFLCSVCCDPHHRDRVHTPLHTHASHPHAESGHQLLHRLTHRGLQSALPFWPLPPTNHPNSTASSSCGLSSRAHDGSSTTPTTRSLRLEPGDVLELHGRSGSGKTSMLTQAALACVLPEFWSVPQHLLAGDRRGSSGQPQRKRVRRSSPRGASEGAGMSAAAATEHGSGDAEDSEPAPAGTSLPQLWLGGSDRRCLVLDLDQRFPAVLLAELARTHLMEAVERWNTQAREVDDEDVMPPLGMCLFRLSSADLVCWWLGGWCWSVDSSLRPSFFQLSQMLKPYGDLPSSSSS